MSKFDLRDISQRLTASRDTEAVVSEFLGYLQATRPDWRAALAFYEVSRDALVNAYRKDGDRLVRQEATVSVDKLPARLVRKFFHPSAFSNAEERRSLLGGLFQGSPYYEPDPSEAPSLRPFLPSGGWQSCVCLPLSDQDDVLGMLVLASDKKGAFSRKTLDALIPLKSIAALALAQHLYRAARREGPEGAHSPQAVASDFQDTIRRLNVETAELTQENQEKERELEALSREIELLDKTSDRYKQELEQVKSQIYALEEQSNAATEHLHEAFAQIGEARDRASELRRTISFVKDAFEMLSEEHEGSDFSRTLVAWFCEHFQVDRCSLMLLDESREVLRISAHRGIDPGIASAVKVRVGQGIAGWVAHNRKPLFVRVKNERTDVQHTDQDTYNSDSFISVPLIHNNRLSGVLNLSNKRSGAPFDELDLDRALLAGSVLALTLGGREMVRAATRG